MIPSPIVLFADFFQGAGLLFFFGFLSITKQLPSEKILSRKYIATMLTLFLVTAVALIPLLFEPKQMSAPYALASCYAYGIGFAVGIVLFLLRKRIWKSFL